MFRPMNKKEIEIKKIDGLRMVQFYEISGIAIKSAIPEGKPVSDGCAALAAYYGDNRRINMNETEPCFDLLVNRIYEIYGKLSEKQKAEILMNDYTRSLLETGHSPKENAFFGSYYGMNPVEQPELSFESSFSKRFAPIAQFLAESISKAMDSEPVLNKLQCGWRGMFTLSGLSGEENIAIHCRVLKENDRLYSMSMTNFLKKLRTLWVNLEIDSDYINLVYLSDDEEISGNSRYIFEEDMVRETHSISFRNDEIFFENLEKPFDEVKPDSIPENLRMLLPDNGKISRIYRLPWNTLYVRYSEQKDSDELSIKDYMVTLISPEAGISETRGRREIHNSRTEIRIKTDSFFMRKLLLGMGRVQTQFVPITANANGKYREQLEGRCFIEKSGNNTKTSAEDTDE